MHIRFWNKRLNIVKADVSTSGNKVVCKRSLQDQHRVLIDSVTYVMHYHQTFQMQCREKRENFAAFLALKLWGRVIRFMLQQKR